MGENKKIILIGGFLEIIELCELCKIQVIGIIDKQLKEQYLGYKILGDDKKASNLYKDFGNIPVIIIPDNPKVRKNLVKYYSKIGFNFCNLIHPSATISRYAKIGKGVVIQNGVNISANVVVEDFVKINMYANIMHDCQIGKYSTIAPSAVILGRIKIAECCYIGANATILPGKIIARGAVVGAGSVVTKNVKENATVIGIPAWEIRKDKNVIASGS